jgi:hypothetical protein
MIRLAQNRADRRTARENDRSFGVLPWTPRALPSRVRCCTGHRHVILMKAMV